MFTHHFCWDRMIATGVSLIIIISLIIVTLHTTLADEQPMLRNKYCELIISEMHSSGYLGGNIESTNTQKDECADGYAVKVQNLSHLSNIKTSKPIRKLYIESEFEQTIDIEMLRNVTFDQLIELHLSNVIANNVIDGSQPFKNPLKTLGIHRSHDLDAFIHQFSVESLETLDLSHNQLKNQLNRLYFVNMSNIRVINLTHCQIHQFPSDTFFFVRNTIEVIDLQANRLIKLPSGFLSIMPESRKNHWTLLLNYNPWMCQCDANDNLSEQIVCLENCSKSIVARSGRGIDVHDEQPQYIKGNDVMELKCDDLSDDDQTEMVLLKKQSHNITVERKNETCVKVSVEGPSNAYIVWYNDSFSFQIDSKQSYSESLSCTNKTLFELTVIPKATYTLCALPSEDSDAISPFNCVAYYVNPNYLTESNPIWITTEKKGLVCGIVTGSTLMLTVFGVLLGVFLIRKWPYLLHEEKSPYLIDNINRFNKRNSCTTTSIFSVEDNNMDDVPTYITPTNFDFVKPPKENDVVPLDASRLDSMKKQTKESLYESFEWKKLPIPPSTPKANKSNATENEENNNMSDGKSKMIDKQIFDLPSLDNDEKDKEIECIYAECKFTEKSNQNE